MKSFRDTLYGVLRKIGIAASLSIWGYRVPTDGEVCDVLFWMRLAPNCHPNDEDIGADPVACCCC